MTDTQSQVSNESHAARPDSVDSYESGFGDADPFRALLRSLLRSWWIIVLCGLIALAAGLVVQRQQTKLYTAVAYLALTGNNFQSAISGGYNATNLQSLEDSAAALLTPGREAEAAQAARIRPGTSWSIAVGTSSTSSVMPVQGKAGTAQGAAALADAAANGVIAANAATATTQLTSVRAVIHSQQRAAPTKQQKRTLQAQLNTLSTLQTLSAHSIQIIQSAATPTAPSTTSRTRIGALALVLGLVVGIVIALLRPARRLVGEPVTVS